MKTDANWEAIMAKATETGPSSKNLNIKSKNKNLETSSKIFIKFLLVLKLDYFSNINIFYHYNP